MDETKLAGLLNECTKGNIKAFNLLYAHSSGKLFAIILRIVKQRELAEEVLQEVFLKIWDVAGQYHHSKGKVMSWMGSIARNRSIDVLRNKDPEPAQVILEELEPDNLPTFSVSSDLGQCLDDLQEAPRNALLMAYYEGYTHEELSNKLTVSLGTVKSWIRRSLQKLKLCLDA